MKEKIYKIQIVHNAMAKYNCGIISALPENLHPWKYANITTIIWFGFIFICHSARQKRWNCCPLSSIRSDLFLSLLSSLLYLDWSENFIEMFFFTCLCRKIVYIGHENKRLNLISFIIEFVFAEHKVMGTQSDVNYCKLNALLPATIDT